MLAIRNNLMAENAARHLGRSYDALATSVERLASGLRINTSKDDAAGLAVRELIRADVATFRQASRNCIDGINLLQTSEGAMSSMDEILIRMKELAEQASNDTFSAAQRQVMDDEFTELSAEVTRIANSTKYNEQQLLAAAGTTIKIHVGDSTIDVTSADMTSTGLGIDSTAAVKEVWQHTIYKASADDLYLQAADITGGGVVDHIKFTFSVDVAAVNVDLDGYSATGISLNDMVAEINTTAGYAAATAEYDSTYKAYRVHITAETAGDTTCTWDATGAQILQFDNVNDFVGSAPLVDGSDAGGSVSLGTATAAQAALTAVGGAIETKDSYRAKLGYWMKRLEAASAVLDVQAENLLAAESRISDVDVATEMASLTRSQVLSQAGVAMLATANTMPQMALTLLR